MRFNRIESPKNFEQSLTSLVGIPYSYGAAPFPLARDIEKQFQASPQANCQRFIQLCFYRLFDIELTPEQLRAPESINKTGVLVHKGTQNQIPWKKIKPFDLFFIRRSLSSLNVVLNTDFKLRWHIAMISNPHEKEFIHSSYYLGKKTRRSSASTFSNYHELKNIYNHEEVFIRRILPPTNH